MRMRARGGEGVKNRWGEREQSVGRRRRAAARRGRPREDTGMGAGGGGGRSQRWELCMWDSLHNFCDGASLICMRTTSRDARPSRLFPGHSQNTISKLLEQTAQLYPHPTPKEGKEKKQKKKRTLCPADRCTQVFSHGLVTASWPRVPVPHYRRTTSTVRISEFVKKQRGGF